VDPLAAHLFHPRNGIKQSLAIDGIPQLGSRLYDEDLNPRLWRARTAGR
jgi:hypothetical protein